MLKPYRQPRSIFERLKGRLGESASSTPLFLPRCNLVHTYRMKFPLTLAWVDRDGRIIQVHENVLPGQIAHYGPAAGVVEFHLDEIKENLIMNTKIVQLTKNTFWRNQSGQALVEVALVLPVLLLIVFGFLQVGLAMHQQQKLQYVTHYATQVGSITNDPIKISGAIETLFNVEDYQLEILSLDEDYQAIDDFDRQHGDVLTVRVTTPFNLSIPILPITHLNLKSEATTRILCPTKSSPYHCAAL